MRGIFRSCITRDVRVFCESELRTQSEFSGGSARERMLLNRNVINLHRANSHGLPSLTDFKLALRVLTTNVRQKSYNPRLSL